MIVSRDVPWDDSLFKLSDGVEVPPAVETGFTRFRRSEDLGWHRKMVTRLDREHERAPTVSVSVFRG